MTKRREFLQLGLTASIGSALPAGVLAFTDTTELLLKAPVYKVLYDTRVEQSLSGALALRNQLVRESAQPDLLYGVDGDLTRFWYKHLSKVWQQQAVPLAGTTSPDILFCLEQLARDFGLRVIWRKEHVSASESQNNNVLVMWIIAPIQVA